MEPAGVVQFSPDFASPGQWAEMYRACGLQVVPSHAPSRGGTWKIPALKTWKEFQNNLTPDATFQRWYAPGGEFATHPNMGVLTGRASGNLMIIDLDEYKTPDAAAWWHGLMEVHNNGSEIETAQQVTGGGGRQILLRCPDGYRVPTNRTPIGVDIRGQGGFAVLPPSMHSSGKNYSWKEGCEPWECGIETAPDWLCEAVTKLVEQHGGDQNRQPVAERTSTPMVEVDAFGARIDGREEYMRDVVWAAVVDWHRECPIPPSEAESLARMRETYMVYERHVKSRLAGDTTESLEREGRGHSAFLAKWRRAMAQWPAEVAQAAAARPTEIAPPEPLPDPNKPLLLSSAEFIAGFRPPEYLIDGIVQRSYLYSLTARTGHGKTAVDMYMAQAVARGLNFHGKGVKQGAVLFLAGENPDDVRARFLVLADHHKFDPKNVPIHFVDGVVNIAACLPRIREEADRIPNLTLVIVDTAAAYFRGDDGNSNAQQGEYARLLRQLTFLPGKPACIVNCHPVKNASRDNLLPVGGGAFLNEVDGNLTLWANAEKQASLHWQGKFRGPEFQPMAFEMRTVQCDAVKNAAGELMPSVIADPIGELALKRGEREQEDDENLVLKIIRQRPHASLAEIAIAAGWVGPGGDANKSKVNRICLSLLEDKLLEKHRKKYRLTRKGKREIGEKIDDEDD